MQSLVLKTCLTLFLLVGLWLPTERGIASSRFDNGMRAYETGDPVTAAILLRPEAEAGKKQAQLALGYLFYSGQGVAQDTAQAARWFERAAGAGEPAAMYNMAWLYQHGEGVAQNQSKADIWLEAAAKAGYPLAQYEWAQRLEYNGNRPQAEHYRQLAAKAGYQPQRPEGQIAQAEQAPSDVEFLAPEPLPELEPPLEQPEVLASAAAPDLLQQEHASEPQPQPLEHLQQELAVAEPAMTEAIVAQPAEALPVEAELQPLLDEVKQAAAATSLPTASVPTATEPLVAEPEEVTLIDPEPAQAQTQLQLIDNNDVSSAALKPEQLGAIEVERAHRVSTQAALAAEFDGISRVVRVSVTLANLKAGPSADSKTVRRLIRGVELITQEQQEQWVKVSIMTQPTVSGWLSRSVIE